MKSLYNNVQEKRKHEGVKVNENVDAEDDQTVSGGTVCQQL